MKKITLLLIFLSSFVGFSQTPLENIKTYLNENRSKIVVQDQDISDIVIVSEFSSESTGINNYHVKQRHQGIEVYSSDSNFWIKNGKVLNGGDEFINNISQKVNATSPVVNVVNGFLNSLTQLNETPIATQILQNNDKTYKLSNGNLSENPVFAQLVYFSENENSLKLAWDYEFYSQDTNHLWRLKVDAINGQILEKTDLVLSCSFEANHTGHSHDLVEMEDSFTTNLFKQKQNQFVVNPGNTAYNVIPWNYESPSHTTRSLVSNPEEVVNASPKGWHDTNSLSGTASLFRYNYTRGNNVWAKNDFAGTNPNTTTGTTSATGTGTFPNLTFDFPYPGTSAVASTYINAAITNLFYMNNVMHDLWYQYGFNEANGNFQAQNYGKGGAQGDFVLADAQDGSQAAPPNLNNANFSTPVDGSSPRMQMYLWNVGPSFFTINSPADIAGGKVARDNSFTNGHVEIPLSPNGITANLVLYDDGVANGSDACEPAINGAALTGKIAVIRRADCTFASKVKLAQNAGAVAVVIVNNVPGEIGMAGDDATIVIPAISVSQEVGEELITKMLTQTVNATLERSSTFVNSDGDFDNGIVAHEYGHGISTRLSGNCLSSSEQQGEGWSDWFWLMMQIKPGDTRNGARGIGTFASNQPPTGRGIREFRYSTDMAVDPHTFGDTNDMWFVDATDGSERIDVHSVGSVWAVMLWDLAWNYIDKYGYNPNIYSGNGGNNKVMRLVLDAIKLDGCAPSFITARDAILAADLATTGGADYCMIWSTFARRGLGVNASSGTNSGVAGIQDQVESFIVPTPGTTPATGSNCTLGINYFDNEDMFKVYPNPTNGDLNVRIANFTGKVTIQIVDINGRVVKEYKNTDFNVEKTLNINNLQSGMYVIKVASDDLNFTKKIIKN